MRGIDKYAVRRVTATATVALVGTCGFLAGVAAQPDLPPEPTGVVVVTRTETVAPIVLHPFLDCEEDEVWTWLGDYPADLLQYECIPLDDLNAMTATERGQE